LRELAQQSRYFYEEYEAIDEAAAKKHLKAAAREPLALIRTKLAALDSWETEALHQVIQDTATELNLGMGKVGMPLRVAVTGVGQSPSIDAVMQLIGKERVLARLDKVLALLPAAE
jgi:glutamyl-tRNA synthetase